MTQTIYTTAPEAYDGFSTRTVNPDVGTDRRGQIIRVVEIDDVDVDWQTGRYRSGLHAAWTSKAADEFFQMGIWTRREVR